MSPELIAVIEEALARCVRFRSGKHYIESDYSHSTLRQSVYKCKSSWRFRNHGFQHGVEEDGRFFVRYKAKQTEVNLPPVGTHGHITVGQIKKAIAAGDKGYNWLKATGLDSEGWEILLDLEPRKTTFVHERHFYIEPSEACREMPNVQFRRYKYTTPVHSKKFVVVTRIK
jgi:hypothetical protein